MTHIQHVDDEGEKAFVLDHVNDKFARQALAYYAYMCSKEYPEIAQEIWIELRESWKPEHSQS